MRQQTNPISSLPVTLPNYVKYSNTKTSYIEPISPIGLSPEYVEAVMDHKVLRDRLMERGARAADADADAVTSTGPAEEEWVALQAETTKLQEEVVASQRKRELAGKDCTRLEIRRFSRNKLTY